MQGKNHPSRSVFRVEERTVILFVIFLLGGIVAVDAVEAVPVGLEAPRNLRCEYLARPLGIDVRAPRFSWEVQDDRRGAKQSAYQILVADSLEALRRGRPNMWDSGKVVSDRSIHVVYQGKPLRSRTRYFWTVRTWDQNGKVSPYAPPVWFETALLSPTDWKARWIAAGPGQPKEPRVPLKHWIWHPTAKADGQVVFLRGTFKLPADKKIKRAMVQAAADDQLILFVNGARIGQHGSWRNLCQFDIADKLRPGRNSIAVQARNGAGPCGVILGLRIWFEDGTTYDFSTDSSWKASSEPQKDWQTPGFNDTAWVKAAVVGRYGDQPWGKPTAPAERLRSVMVHKEFSLPHEVQRARVYVTGLGLYELRINGKRVGGDVFTPGWTLYSKRLQYQTYDVTELLKKGPNAVGLILGNGWWSGGLGWAGRFMFGKGPLRCLLQLEVTTKGGKKVVVTTDRSWKWNFSPILDNSFYDGEVYDARLETPGWDLPGFNDKGWKPVELLEQVSYNLIAQQTYPIRVTQELTVKRITEPLPGVYVFDFGQNAAGRVRLKVKASRGTRIKIRFAEVLNPDGTIYTANYRSAKATDIYICRGEGVEYWEPRFTYRGFRYAELTGYPGAPPADALVFRVMHTAAPFAGKFRCSDELINHIWRNTLWGQRSNLYSVPTDCPQRDERLGWMGDAQLFAPTSCWNMDLATFYTKWMRDIRDSQGEDGHTTDVSPVAVVSGPAKPGWGDAVTVIPWTVYRFYGDKRIIEENFDSMAAWVEYMRRHAKGDLYEREGYGDWVAVVPSPKKPIGAAYYYWSTKLLSRMAAAIGKEKEAERYGKLAERIAEAFNAAYLDRKTGWYPGKTQTAQILPLALGITPPDQRTKVFKKLHEDVVKRGYHHSTGFLGTAYILPVLEAFGKAETAWRVVTQRTFPSWGYMIEKGATTIWELWDSDKKGPGMNSRNHFCFGSVVQWFYEGLAGLRNDPEEPGFKRVIVHPHPVGRLRWARASYHSMYGMIWCYWERRGKELRLEVRIPANTTAEVHLPTRNPKTAFVSESGKALLKAGKVIGEAPGVSFKAITGDSVVFEIGAGHYVFTAK